MKTHLVKVRFGEGGRAVICYCGISGVQHIDPPTAYRTASGFLFHATAQYCTCMRCRRARKKSEARNEERNQNRKPGSAG